MNSTILSPFVIEPEAAAQAILDIKNGKYSEHVKLPLRVVVVLGVALMSCSSVKEDPALLTAAQSGRVEEIRRLIASGADVNARDRSRFKTPLMKAAAGGQGEAARTLIHAGAQVDARDGGGRTALIHASRAGHTELIQLLLQAGADVNARDDSGDTAFLEAAFCHRIDALPLLLGAGADLNAMGRYGDTALSQAVAYGDTDVASWLRRAGAKERRELLGRLLFTSLTQRLGSTIGGIIFVAVGLWILSGRPLVLNQLVYSIFVFLIAISGPTHDLPRKLLEGRADLTQEWHWPVLFLAAVAMMFVSLLLTRRYYPVSILNVGKDAVYDAILTLLRSEDIPYEEKGSRILLPSSRAATEILVRAGSASGTVSLQFWSLAKKDAREIARKITPALRRTLKGDPRHRQTFFGAFNVGIGLLILALPVLVLALFR